MVLDKERILKAMSILGTLWLDYRIKDDVTRRVKRYSKFAEKNNKIKVKSAITLLRNTDIIKGAEICIDCNGSGKVVCKRCGGVR